jgi:uncharacterized lipoprotein YddW (UPF0748 family)|tara:strand:+ start:2283 stop:4130 length:1848 start_codon:yes stop_codon:yes gene_type:complete
MSFKFHFLFLFFCLTLSTGFSQNEEFRATWVITWDHINRYETPWQNLERVAKIMDDHADANMNAVIFQVRQSGTAYYQSSYEPWGYYSGYQNPGYDPLEVAIEEAHARGMELHAWFNVFQTSSTHNGTPAAEHPEWICRDQNGSSMTSYRAVSPGLEEVRNYTVNVAMEIVKNYDIDGLHLDYVRWNEHTNSQRNSPTLQDELKRLDGSITENEIHELASNPSGRFLYDYEHPYSAGIPNGFSSWEEWWRWSVTEFVSTLHDSIQAVKPHVKLSAAVLGKYNWSGWQGYGTVYQDGALWYNEGYLDHIMPMSYHWTSANGFLGMLSADCPDCWELFIQSGIESGRPFTVGPGSYILDDNNVWNNHSEIVNACRSLSWVDGYQFFSYGTWRDKNYFGEAGETFFFEKSKIQQNPLGSPSKLDPPVIVLSSTEDGNFDLDIYPKEIDKPNWIITYQSTNPTASSETADIIDIQFTKDSVMVPIEIATYDTSQTQFFFSTTADRFWQESAKSNLVLISGPGDQLTKSFDLFQNYPNPFTKKTTVLLATSYKRDVELVIWSLDGKKVKILLDDQLYPGYYFYDWTGLNDAGQQIASGIYFCTLGWNDKIIDSKKLIYVK